MQLPEFRTFDVPVIGVGLDMEVEGLAKNAVQVFDMGIGRLWSFRDVGEIGSGNRGPPGGPRLDAQSSRVEKYQSTVVYPSPARAIAAAGVAGVGTITGSPGTQFSGMAQLFSSAVCIATSNR